MAVTNIMVKRAKKLKAETREKRVREEVLAISESIELEFKSNEEKLKFEEWVQVNSKDSYSLGIVEYSCRWAKCMQYLMKKHNKNLYEIADNASSISNIDNITVFMYGCAVEVLSYFWKYGEELRKWHNKECGYKDTDGVVNPAMISIKVG